MLRPSGGVTALLLRSYRTLPLPYPTQQGAGLPLELNNPRVAPRGSRLGLATRSAQIIREAEAASPHTHFPGTATSFSITTPLTHCMSPAGGRGSLQYSLEKQTSCDYALQSLRWGAPP